MNVINIFSLEEIQVFLFCQKKRDQKCKALVLTRWRRQYVPFLAALGLSNLWKHFGEPLHWLSLSCILAGFRLVKRRRFGCVLKVMVCIGRSSRSTSDSKNSQMFFWQLSGEESLRFNTHQLSLNSIFFSWRYFLEKSLLAKVLMADLALPVWFPETKLLNSIDFTDS